MKADTRTVILLTATQIVNSQIIKDARFVHHTESKQKQMTRSDQIEKKNQNVTYQLEFSVITTHELKNEYIITKISQKYLLYLSGRTIQLHFFYMCTYTSKSVVHLKKIKENFKKYQGFDKGFQNQSNWKKPWQPSSYVDSNSIGQAKVPFSEKNQHLKKEKLI